MRIIATKAFLNGNNEYTCMYAYSDNTMRVQIVNYLGRSKKKLVNINEYQEGTAFPNFINKYLKK